MFGKVPTLGQGARREVTQTSVSTHEVPNTLAIQIARADQTIAGDMVLAVMRNVGATILFVSDQPNVDINSARVFIVDPGQREEILLAPRQRLYAISGAPGGLLSVAMSEVVV